MLAQEVALSREKPEPPERRKRGFASMDPNLVRDLARKGGVAAHRAGTAHEFSSEEARVAGRKGGKAAHAASRRAAGPRPSEPEAGEEIGDEPDRLYASGRGTER